MPGVELHDRKTGKAVSFETADDAAAAFAGGTHAPVASADVPIIGPDGSVGTVAGKDLGQALAAGSKLADHDEYRQAQLEAKYGTAGSLLGLANQFQTQGFAAARGATAGLSDAALVEGAKLWSPDASESIRTRLSELKELNPVSSIVGEIGGATAGALAGGGVGAGGKAAVGAARLAEGASEVRAGGSALARLLPATGIDALGGAAEQGVGRLLGQGATTALGRAVQSGAGLAARGATEGLIYSEGQLISEEVLGGDPDITAEKLFVAGGKGALFGALGGFALGAGGSLVKSATKGLASTLAPKLEEQAAKQYVAAFDRTPSMQAKIAAVDEVKVGRFIANEGILPMGSRAADSAERASAVVQKYGGEVGAMYSKADALGWKAPSVDSVVSKLEAEMLPLTKAANTNSAEISAFKGIIEDIRSTDPKSFQEWQALRQVISPKAKFDMSRASTVNDAYRSAYSAVRGAIADAGELEAKAAGGEFAKTFAKTNENYRLARIVEDMADLSANRNSKNSGFGLLNTVAMAGGIATGQPLAAVATGIGSKLIRGRGNSTVAGVLDRLAGIGALKEAATRVDEQLTRSAKGILSPVPRPSVKTQFAAADRRSTPQPKEPVHVRYKAAAAHVAEMQADPIAFANRITAQSAMVGANAPKTTAAYAATVARTATYLASQLPAEHVPVGTVLTANRPMRVSDAEASLFLKKYDAATDPETILHAAEHGTANRAQIEVLKNAAPKLFAELQVKTLDELAAHQAAGHPVDWPTRQRLSLMLDIPLDPSMTPEGLRDLQSSYGKSGGGGPAPAPANDVHPPGRPMKAPGPTNAIDRIEAGR